MSLLNLNACKTCQMDSGCRVETARDCLGSLDVHEIVAEQTDYGLQKKLADAAAAFPASSNARLGDFYSGTEEQRQDFAAQRERNILRWLECWRILHLREKLCVKRLLIMIPMTQRRLQHE